MLVRSLMCVKAVYALRDEGVGAQVADGFVEQCTRREQGAGGVQGDGWFCAAAEGFHVK